MLLLGSCDEKSANPNKNLSIDAFAKWKADEYALNSQLIDESLEHLCKQDKDSATADFRTRDYYRHGGAKVWVNRQGASHWADTLLSVLNATVPDMGFTPRSFRMEQIDADLRRLQNLDFDTDNSISQVAARLEYNLTKAYLRYALGQRYGFVNPTYLFNHLEPSRTDTLGNVLDYQRLFAVDMDHAARDTYQQLLWKVRKDSLGAFLREIQPRDTLYQRLKSMLPTADATSRNRLLCNMERRRWRQQKPGSKEKYVIVNVAAFHLWGVSPDTVIDMRVGCGALKTKTPLLNSYFTHMNVNPDWVIPMSIIQNDIARHAGDPSYFSRHGYYISDKKSGNRLSAAEVTRDQLLSGAYRVAQQGGPGNSLGRIIFRFPNNFSVFLHDTSTRAFFGHDNRGVSHGCVRVQHPFELAKFLTNNPDEWQMDKLRISMGLPPETDRGKEYMEREDRPSHPRLIDWIGIKPRVPIYITYYTVYPDPANGHLQTYPDVYGYDKALERALKTYMQ